MGKLLSKDAREAKRVKKIRKDLLFAKQYGLDWLPPSRRARLRRYLAAIAQAKKS